LSPDIVIKSTIDDTAGVPTHSNLDRVTEMDASLAKGKETTVMIDEAALAARKTVIIDKIASQIY
jgi:hypothetical protein